MTHKIPITVMIVPNNHIFKQQLSLAWFAHKKLYGQRSHENFLAIIVKRNAPTEPKNEIFDMPMPYRIVESYFDIETQLVGINEPTFNFTYGLCQILSDFDDDDIIELIDTDMFHIRHINHISIDDREVIVDDMYEEWHLKAKTNKKNLMQPFLKNDINIYNGGFVPIISKVKTFKLIMEDWINIHYRLCISQNDITIRWWSIMYAFNAACDNNDVVMLSHNVTYVPPVNDIANKRICHYSVDRKINKLRSYDLNAFPDNMYYNIIREWHNAQHKII